MDTNDNLEAAFGPRRSVISALMTVALLGVMLDCFQPANAGVRSRISDPTASRGNSHPAQTGKKASTSDNADEAFLAQVSARILAVARKHPANVSWPPAITLVDAGDLNAYANLEVDRLDDGKFKERTDRNGKFIPYVAVDRLMMEEVIQGNPDRLAMLVAHELSHIILGHILPTNIAKRAQTRALKILFTSEQEHDADINGIKLALAAGYSYRGVREIWEVFNSESFSRKYPHSEYSSFEAAGEDHPSWSDRLSYIDKEKANVWKAMSAFENGAIFLQIQQYPSAAESFSRVIQEFPDNYEAWVNLGYARLMMYLDAFDPNTLKRYDIGQVVVGSFYLRPEELRSRSRGDNAAMWQQAVDALRKALDLKPDLSMAMANLGVAYLLNPAGRDARAASELLEQAIASLTSDKNLYNYNVGAILINAAVADLANDQVGLAARRLQEAREFLQGEPVLSGAIDYNLALVALRPDGREQVSATAPDQRRRSASSLLLRFLKSTSPASVWWDLGYEKYVRLRTEEGLKPEGKPALTEDTKVRLRRISSVEVAPGMLVTLSDRSEQVKAKVQPLTILPVVGTTIELLHHPPSGSDILVGRRVVAIYLRGPTAPGLKIQPLGTGARSSFLGTGMTKKDVEQMLGRDYMVASLNDPDFRYYFYPALDVGVHYDIAQRVDELVLAQIAFTPD